MEKRLFIVANRLPVTIEQADNYYRFRQSSGGLVSAIKDYLAHGGSAHYSSVYWAGVPGCTQAIWDKVTDVPADFHYLPVFMPEDLYEGYYSGFSNSVLWPLFHYFPSFADYSPENFDAYNKANEVFAASLAAQLRKDDVVWIHDYHLMPLAAKLRELVPGVAIGFFLHIPFPSYELFRVIPKHWQHSILTGMLGADLVGFQTVEYAGHFLSCLEAAMKLEHEGQTLQWNNRQVKVDAFPISIDFERFHNAGTEPEVEQLKAQYLELKGERKLIFSVDRLDYTKGISHRLRGYERFLEQHPEYAGKVVFVLSLVPSRDAISKYAERKRMIDEYIGNLNSRLGSITWQPVIYQYNHLSFEELVALYASCDLALITPLRDGMNLVAKEFVASRQDKKGVLVLSEMAGAAKELTEALLINPNDATEIAAMLKRGLEMNEQEQQERMASMQTRIARYDVVAWATDFFEQLQAARASQIEFEIKFVDKVSKVELISQYSSAAKRLLLLDYDGTLVSFANHPTLAVPTPELLQVLDQLARQPQNEIFIISGRDSQTLERWLGHLPIGLIAEHGAKIRHKEGFWEPAAPNMNADWKQRVEKLMNHYVAKCPHSFIEHKEFSLAWHYRAATLQDGTVRAKEAYEDLRNLTAQQPLQVLQGNKVIEVRYRGINKGAAVKQILNGSLYDFVLCVGDDKTDEDMFRKLARTPEAFTIKVGGEASFAKYNLHNTAAVLSLLQNLSQVNLLTV